MPAKPLKNNAVTRTSTVVVGPQMGLVELNSHRSDDWALRSVNSTMCDGRKSGRHEWVSTYVRDTEKRGNEHKRDGTHNAAQASMPTHFVESIRQPGALIAAPWTPG
jgi:hypothetical protein